MLALLLQSVQSSWRTKLEFHVSGSSVRIPPLEVYRKSEKENPQVGESGVGLGRQLGSEVFA